MMVIVKKKIAPDLRRPSLLRSGVHRNGLIIHP